MKKYLKTIFICLFVSVFFISCSNDTTLPEPGTEVSDNESQESTPKSENGSPDNRPAGTPSDTPVITNTTFFDLSNAKAIAKLERSQISASVNSRTAVNNNQLGEFVKILSDGSMQNAINVTNGYLADVKAVYQSPLQSSTDIYILFQGSSFVNGTQIGSFVCVHEDGTFADILKNPENNSYYMSPKEGSIMFDAAGNVYFISNNYSTGDVIYQFNPEINTLTKMVAGVQGTSYSKILIDKEGEWIFASGNRSSSSFLRAIPINNPNNPVNIFYSSTYGGIGDYRWIYDDNTSTVYYIAQDGNNSGLFKATKAGGFRNKTLVRNATLTGMENFVPEDLFDSFTSQHHGIWKDSFITDGVFDANKVVSAILASKNLSINDVDIKFDKYLSEGGSIKALAYLTKNKKNSEAFEALNNDIGIEALTSAKNFAEGYFEINYSRNGTYNHNFLADILYVKNTDILLSDVQDELFPKNNGYYINHDFFDFFSTSTWHAEKTYCYQLKRSAGDFLSYLYSFCNITGDKEFKLTAFQNDVNYSELYSTLKNEEALQWICANYNRLTLFNEAMGDIYKILSYYTNYCNNNSVSHTYNSFFESFSNYPYYKEPVKTFLSFIAKTCYLTGTDTKAMSWNKEELFSIYYYQSGKLIASNEGVFFEYSNLTDYMPSSIDTTPYYYLVEIAKPTGENAEESIKKITLPSGKVVSSKNTQDRIFMQYSLMQNGSELGYHHIYSVDLNTGVVKNHFDNVPNRNGLEVISFSTAGDKLYYSAVRGTSVENGVVDINTNEYNPLQTQRKMVAVYALR